MAGKILLEVVTPEKLLLSQQVDELIAEDVGKFTGGLNIPGMF